MLLIIIIQLIPNVIRKLAFRARQDLKHVRYNFMLRLLLRNSHLIGLPINGYFKIVFIYML